jgi:hypothetical protein
MRDFGGYYLSPLHFAASSGDVKKIKRLLARDPLRINVTDRNGSTALHYAVMKNKLNAAKVLIANGADIDCKDVDGYPPIFYTKIYSQLGLYLLEKGAKAFDMYVTPLHHAAATGNIKGIKAALHYGIDELDEEGRSPLLYAARAKQKAAIDFLLKMGADPYISDNDEQNIITFTKRNFRHTKLSRYVKQKIGFSKDALTHFAKKWQQLFKTCLDIAKRNQKKLVILLGEKHGDYRLYQLEKKLLASIAQLGIKHLFVECEKDDDWILDEYRDMTKKIKPGMNIIGVDNHPQKVTASVNKRNGYMKEGITAVAEHGVLITGVNHLYGLAKKRQTKLSAKQFEIIPVNLTALFDEEMQDEKESKYAFDKEKVLQLRML